jgi:hypothetical protein
MLRQRGRERFIDGHLHAAQPVRQSLESCEIDHGNVIYGLCQEVFNGADHKGNATEGQGCVDLC